MFSRAGKTTAVRLRALPSSVRRHLTSRALVYARHGQPEEVLEVCNEELPDSPASDHLLLETLAAPVNPADINMIQGTYPVKPSLEASAAVGGNEGVFRVLKSASCDFKEGDLVIPAVSCLGTWRSHAHVASESVMRIDDSSGVDTERLGTMAVNPCTALLMLTSFCALQDDQVVVQNLGTSGVARAVREIALDRRWRTLSVVRDRSDDELEALRLDFDDSVRRLLGANAVETQRNRHLFVCESDLKKRDVRADIARTFGVDEKCAPLALNGVGGRSSMQLTRFLQHGGTLVTYGGMSRQPVTLPTGAFIFDDIVSRGFWMTRWNAEHSRQERQHVLQQVLALMRRGAFAPSVHSVDVAALGDHALLAAFQQPHQKLLFRFAE
ncbi:MAG: hypothetical protein MHM6MM_002763 [Cercozoa sp. M6MM]